MTDRHDPLKASKATLHGFPSAVPLEPEGPSETIPSAPPDVICLGCTVSSSQGHPWSGADSVTSLASGFPAQAESQVETQMRRSNGMKRAQIWEPKRPRLSLNSATFLAEWL